MTGSHAAEPSGGAAQAGAAGLLVITVDRLPAWILPVYGATWVAAPAINRLAAAGVTFDRMILSGDDPRRVVGELVGERAANADESGVFAAGRARGWRMVVVTDAPDVAPRALGVERIVVDPRPASGCAEEAAATNLGRLFAAAAAAMAAGKHDLVWCHAGSLGLAWDAPASFHEAYVDPDDPPPAAEGSVPEMAVTAATDPDLVMGVRQAFAAQVTLLDHCLTPLVDAVLSGAGGEAAAKLAGWAVLFAGVRGMSLGAHGRIGVAPLPPYGEIVHVPAIVVAPRGAMAAQRYGGIVMPADVGRLLTAIVAGGDEPSEGRGLAGLFRDWSAPERDRAIVAGAVGTAVATAAWHYVEPRPMGDEDRRTGRLFAKPDDYFELCDVADRCPDVAEELARIAQAAEAGDWERAWREPLAAAARPSS